MDNGKKTFPEDGNLVAQRSMPRTDCTTGGNISGDEIFNKSARGIPSLAKVVGKSFRAPSELGQEPEERFVPCTSRIKKLQKLKTH